MTASLSPQQDANVKNHSVLEGALEPRTARNQNSNEACAPRANAAAAAAEMETTVARMSQAAVENQAHLRFYIVNREYELFGQKADKTRSRVIATVTFRPPDSKDYRVQGIEGSLVGGTIVRQVLEREASLAKDGGVSSISHDNYDFQFLREEVPNGRRWFVLRLLPKRKDNSLLRGTIWVDANTYLIRRTEGGPPKNPSWWLRNLHIVLIYAEVGGMWLPTSCEFTAKVRLLGVSTILVHDLSYSYSQFAEAGTIPETSHTQVAQHRITASKPLSQSSKTG
jgi:hypothetical protein